MSNNSYSKFLIFSLLMLASLGGIFAISPFRNTDDRLSQLTDRVEALSQIPLDTIPGSGNARVLANVINPNREGFPFCEPFTGDLPRLNAIWEVDWKPGLNNIDALTGTSLQLTSAGTNENGYVFVDIPFSSAFGLKVSFDYYSHGGNGADGFSFFMFDGSINPSTFNIGATGGALGYTPLNTSSNSASASPGLKGAYIGVGFDELGNFGNSVFGKYGGFEDVNETDPSSPKKLFKHSVVVRGPVQGLATTPLSNRDRINNYKNGVGGDKWDSYKFVDGRIFDSDLTNIDYIGIDPKFFHLQKMTIDAIAQATDCFQDGFRRVFLDLNPIDVLDRSKGYTVQIYMLVNRGIPGDPQLITVFDNPVVYDLPAPEFLKVGFAAATGAQTNKHEIANVTVQVSNQVELKPPKVPSLTKAVCEGESNTFTLDVELLNDVDNAFIRCLQLFEDEPEALAVVSGIIIPFPTFPLSPDPLTYCPNGICVDLLCLTERLLEPAFDDVTGVPAGDFEVFLIDSAGIEVPKVRFTPALGYSGVTTVWYTATDNFGQVSLPQPITITINPNPEPVLTTLDPLVWEQSEKDDISVLWDSGITGTGYTYRWFIGGTLIPLADQPTYLATEPGDYTVEVTTTPQGCVGSSAGAVTIRLVADLNPVLTKTREDCNELGTIQVNLDYAPVSAGSSNGEKWRIIDIAGNVVVNWRNLAVGQSVINYPEPNDLLVLTAGAYVFQIGDNFRSELSTPPRFRHERDFTIDPIQNPLQITLESSVPELCFGDGGTITVNGAGGDGPASYVYTVTSTSPSPSPAYSATLTGTAQAVFSNLPQGNYTIGLKSGSRSICEVNIPAIVSGPSAPLSIALVDSGGTSCSVATSAFATWEVLGGTPGYTFVSLAKDGTALTSPRPTQNAGVFAFTNLTTGTYILTVKDYYACEISSPPIQLNDIPPTEFEVLDAEACEGSAVTLAPVIVVSSTPNPVFTWMTPQGAVITNGSTAGVTYTFSDHDFNSSTPDQLSISGLSAGTYQYTVSISGANSCNFMDFPTVKVYEYPPVADVVPTNVDCFGDNSGALEVVMAAGADPTTFSYEIVGIRPVQDSPIFTALPAGTYQIRVTNKITSCITNRNNVLITQPDQLAVQNLLPFNPTCGASNGSVKFEIIGGVAPYTVKMNNLFISDYPTHSIDAGVYEVRNLAPGPYSLEILDANGCQRNLPNEFTLTNDTGFNVVLNPLKDEVCLGQDLVLSPVITSAIPVTPVFNWYKDAAGTQLISSSAAPDLDGITYQINPANGRLTISGQSVGSFNYYLEISGPGICTVVKTADAEVFPELTALITPTNITCFGDTDGAITIVPSGGNGVFEVSFNNSPFTTNFTYSNLAPGSYPVEIRNDIGCTFPETVLVESPTAAIAINTPTIERASCNLANGSIRDLVISGGWGNYTVEWRAGSISGPVISGTVSEALDLLPNTYYLIVSDAEGCTEEFDFRIGESSDPVYAIVPPINSCVGTPVTIRPLHIANPSLPPAAATEVRWYTDPGQIGLIQNGADPVLPGVNYTIDDTDWLNPELVVTGLPAGTYDFYFYVVFTGQEIPVSITVFDTPAVVLDTTPITCFGDTNGKISILSGALPMYTYSIDGAAPISQLAFEALSLAAGTYALTVSTPAGCAQTETFTIAGPTAPLASSPLTKIDPGCGAPNGKLELTITGGWLPYTLDVIKDGVSQGTTKFNVSNILLDGYRPGTYQVIITDKEGCTVTTNSVLLVDGPTQVLADPDEICVGSIASLVPRLDPIAPGATFQWYLDAATSQAVVSSPNPAADGRIYQINATTGELTIENLPASATDYMYYVIASGTGVCPGFTGNGRVRVFDNPNATAAVANEVCFDSGGTITVTATGGSGAYTYSLDGGAFGTSNVFQVPRGTYEVVVQTPQGCSTTLSNIIVSGPSAALEVNDVQVDSPSCALTNGEIRFTVAGGYPPYTISYTKDGVNAGVSNLALPGVATISNLGEGSYLFQITDGGGCVISLPSTVTLTEIPTVISSANQVICEGETASLTASLPLNILSPSYVWSLDPAGVTKISSSTVDDVSYAVNPDGTMNVVGLSASGSPYTYYVMASGPGICGLSPKPVTVTVNSIPVLRVSNPATVCDPTGTVDLTNWIEGFNPIVYDYNVLSPSGAAMRLDELSDVATRGTYLISSSRKGIGCFNPPQRMLVRIADTELVANFQYEADLGGGILIPNAEIQIQEDVTFQDLSQGDVLIWEWDFGDGNSSNIQNPVHQYQDKGTYTVRLTATDIIGCISIYEVVVQALDDYLVMVPSAFTPTGAKNLTFKPFQRGISSMEFYIFSTWGELIYEAKTMEDSGWDGTVNGTPAIPGNYVYRGRFVSRSGEVIDKSGVFILIR